MYKKKPIWKILALAWNCDNIIGLRREANVTDKRSINVQDEAITRTVEYDILYEEVKYFWH